tara:strand:+ start:67 stop:369 length:303 start_codon:yes stop_codon:yes gene_type:complete
MHTCIILNTNNTYEIKKIDHKQIDKLCNEFTFVGAIPQFNVIAVGSKNTEGQDFNSYCNNSEYFDVPVKGNVILLGSDEDGEAMNLNTDPILEFLISFCK